MMKKNIFLLIFFFIAIFLYAGDDSLQGMMDAAGIKGNFSMGWLFGALVFGAVGIFSFLYGKKKSRPVFIIIGIVLTVYPYITKDIAFLYIIGGMLSLSLYFFRK